MPDQTGIHHAPGGTFMTVPGSPRETLQKFKFSLETTKTGFTKFDLDDETPVWINPRAVLFLTDES